MLKGAIARRYAEAVFDLARKQGTLDRTLEDVKEIAQVLANRNLAFLLREPKIAARRKETAIRQALAEKVLPTSLNLTLLIVQRELVDLMPNIASELEQLVLDYRNEAIAEVTTAAPLSEIQQTSVKRALETRTGKTIIMQTHVDPSILGGIVARVGDQVIDGSIRYRLSALQQRLLNSVSTADIDFLSEELAKLDHSTADTEATHPTHPSQAQV